MLSILSVFEDLGQGMTRLKQLVDIYLLLRQLDATMDWQGFFGRRKRENVATIAKAVLELVVGVFEVGGEVPRLVDALETPRAPIAARTRAEMLELVFAARKDPRNMEWFGRVYPGNLSRYLLSFWMGGFPANVTGPSLTHAIAAGRIALGRRHGQRETY